jgi:hypothetical protein
MIHDEKAAVAIILGKIKPKGAGHAAEEHMESHPDESLHAISEEVLHAVKAGDASALADALKAFFHVADAMPHEEGEHVPEEREYE